MSGEVQIVEKNKCDISSNKITSTTLCAGPYFVNGCETDDGSPMVCGNKIHGLIDFRAVEYCSMIITNRLGTYIDISEFRDWIATHQNSASRKFALSGLIITVSTIFLIILS